MGGDLYNMTKSAKKTGGIPRNSEDTAGGILMVRLRAARGANPAMLCCAREGYANACPFPDLALNLQFAVIPRDNVLDDGQTEARAADHATAALVHAIEAFENTRNVFSGDADAVVLNRERGNRVFICDPDRYTPARVGVFNRVVNQV